MNQKFLKAYSGQTTEQLIALDGEYRVDSIVLAFEVIEHALLAIECPKTAQITRDAICGAADRG